MKKRYKFLSLLCGAFMLSGCYLDLGFLQIGTPPEEEEADVIEEDKKTVETYYEGYDLDLGGTRLAMELQKQCFDKHTKWVTYGQVNSYYKKTKDHESVEAIAQGSSVNQWFYTGKEAEGYGTREHVWPCANSSLLWSHDSSADVHYVDYSGYVGGGSDLFHVRTANSAVNTARGNSRFVSFDSPEYSQYKSDTLPITESGGKYSLLIYDYETTTSGQIQYAKKAEPADELKGDVARILLYVWIHYTKRNSVPEGSVQSGSRTYKYSDMVGSLGLSDIMGYDEQERCLEILREWNKIDPPSEVEKLRNITVQKIQGNRNMFVDYPSLVDQL